MEKMTSGVFRVDLRQESNNLEASVEVMSLTSSSAKMFALRKFFPKGWEVVKVTKVRDLPPIDSQK
jgi:hypothetical protein